MDLRDLRESYIGKVVDKVEDKVEDEFDKLLRSTRDSTVICTKGYTMMAKLISKADREKDPNKKLKMYKQALKEAKAIRAEARKIPPDSWTDQLARAIINDPISYTLTMGKAMIIDKDVKNITRNTVLKQYDTIIKSLEVKISKLEKKSK